MVAVSVREVEPILGLLKAEVVGAVAAGVYGMVAKATRAAAVDVVRLDVGAFDDRLVRAVLRRPVAGYVAVVGLEGLVGRGGGAGSLAAVADAA